MDGKPDNLETKIEALLFLYGEPVEMKKLAKILDVQSGALRNGIDTLKNSLQDRGLHIIETENKVQLTTKPSLKEFLTGVVDEEFDTGLTPASMETLAIIAYLGPCRRSIVEYIRGVNSSFILRSLMIRGLVEREQDPGKANTYLYKITFDFLRHMGLDSVRGLPNHEKYRDLLTMFTKSNVNESNVNEGSQN
jgi:segregation and condensation protein B